MARAKSKDLAMGPPAKVTFVEPMYARLVQKLPEGKEWLYEVKLDGYRASPESRNFVVW